MLVQTLESLQATTGGVAGGLEGGREISCAPGWTRTGGVRQRSPARNGSWPQGGKDGGCATGQIYAGWLRPEVMDRGEGSEEAEKNYIWKQDLDRK